MAATNKLSIKVRVGDRTYPMTIDRDDEERIREAAARVTDMYARFATKISEPLDRMSFVAFEMAMQSKDKRMQESVDDAIEEIGKMCVSIDKQLTRR